MAKNTPPPSAKRQRRWVDIGSFFSSSSHSLPNTNNGDASIFPPNYTPFGVFALNSVSNPNSAAHSTPTADADLLPRSSTPYMPFGVLYPSNSHAPLSSKSLSQPTAFQFHHCQLDSLSHNVFEPGSQLPATCKSQTVLIQKFDDRKTLASNFPPVFTGDTVRASIKWYQAKITATKSHFIHVCASCGLFIALDALKIIHTLDVLFQSAIECGVFVQAGLDLCARIEESYSFCSTCFNSIKKLKLPKFGPSNLVNTVPCQLYPEELEGLTFVEEVFIARAHPVISILKLQPSKSSIDVSYQRVRGHAVVLPQNPRPLLDLLPSDTLVLHDVIRIVWARDRPHTAADIQPFATVQRGGS